ncbi:diguanylate cyclase domain-containing protein [Bowmanella dokdonensis]|uniref:Diguanylate cyclase n=1 Tax=Bowmanella dokdonensis TaxID=751969 RepID=A0A939DST3_9ALTE|nr:diguanylate cyclase [Bowmanella dokdonensis]MBN7827545.1 diguanylate cyclase [Bowmanella dokdonensis]
MSSSKINLLLVMEDTLRAGSIIDAIHQKVPSLHLRQAKTTAEAIKLLTKYDVEMVIIELTSASGLDIKLRLISLLPATTLLLVLGENVLSNNQWLTKAIRYFGETNQPDHPISARGIRELDYQELAGVALDAMGDAVLICDLKGQIIYLNQLAELLTGWPAKQAIDKHFTRVVLLIDSQTRRPVDCCTQSIQEDEKSEHLLLKRDGREVPVEDRLSLISNAEGQIVGHVIVLHDVSRTWVISEKMAYTAYHDSLTGLPNRPLIEERLQQAVQMAIRHRKMVGMLFIDLDQFKLVNDSFGHSVGDELLQSVARRLQDCVRTSDTVCRYGGDEFVILLAEIAHSRDAEQVAEKIIQAFAAPHQLSHRQLIINLSVGISVFPLDAQNCEMLLKHADQAMYLAKGSLQASYQLFQEPPELVNKS